MTTIQESWYYFAYGLNMNAAEMQRKCPRAKIVGIACLHDYRLAFYEHSVVWDSAMETVVPDPGSVVWGVLYELNAGQWEELDNAEDARMDGSGAYFHYPVTVEITGQGPQEATVYLKARWGSSGWPSTEYMDAVIQGAMDQGLPESYIRQLESIDTKPALYAVPKRPKGHPVFTGGCSGCEA